MRWDIFRIATCWNPSMWRFFWGREWIRRLPSGEITAVCRAYVFGPVLLEFAEVFRETEVPRDIVIDPDTGELIEEEME